MNLNSETPIEISTGNWKVKITRNLAKTIPNYKKLSFSSTIEERTRRSIYVSNIPSEVEEGNMMDIFRAFGTVARVARMYGPSVAESAVYWFVVFEDLENLFTAFKSDIVIDAIRQVAVKHCYHDTDDPNHYQDAASSALVWN